MRVEIERKFLVRGSGWRALTASIDHLWQGYLANTPACSVRVRRASGRGWLSVKGMQAGRSRPEFEFAIPEEDAAELLEGFTEGAVIEKLRHVVPFEGQSFEVDEFAGENEGLVIAEIELASAEANVPSPDWLGDEVTEDARFYNFRLASMPFSRWTLAAQEAVRAGRLPPEGST